MARYAYLLTLLPLLLTLLPLPAFSQGPAPAGGEFQVNSYTTGYQTSPALGVDASGTFVVAWRSNGSPGNDDDGYSIQGRRHASDGTPDPQFQVNTDILATVSEPTVGVGPNGHFVVVWQSTTVGIPVDFSISGQRYAPDGMPLGDESTVVTIPGFPGLPAVGVGADGDFVVVWRDTVSAGDDSDNASIQGQRFASDGMDQGTQFQVNTYTTGRQDQPSLAVEPDGDFVVAWQSLGSADNDTDLESIQGQRYASDGMERGGQFEVNTFTTGYQRYPAVAVEPDGDFVVAWQSDGSPDNDSDQTSIQGQRFDAAGTERGSQFQVNSVTTGSQYGPSIAIDSENGFLVAWESTSSTGTDNNVAVLGRRFATDGMAQGNDFQVNSYTPDLQYRPTVGADAAGRFVVAWTSYGSAGDDTEGPSIQGQRYEIPLFADGFELGNTSAWSSTTKLAP